MPAVRRGTAGRVPTVWLYVRGQLHQARHVRLSREGPAPHVQQQGERRAGAHVAETLSPRTTLLSRPHERQPMQRTASHAIYS